MSTTKANIFKKRYSSYGEALAEALEYKGLGKSDLARLLVNEKRNNIRSLETSVHRWTKTDTTPSISSRKQINDKLHMSIQMDDNEWVIVPDVHSMLDDQESSAASSGLSSTSRGELLEYVQGRIQSLSSELEELARLLMTLRK